MDFPLKHIKTSIYRWCSHVFLMIPYFVPCLSQDFPMSFPCFSLIFLLSVPQKNLQVSFLDFLHCFPTSQNLHIVPMKTVASGAARQHEIHQADHAETTRRHLVGQTSPVSFAPAGISPNMGGRLGSTSKNALKFMMEAEKVHKKLQKKYETYRFEQQKLVGIWLGYHRICLVI